MVRYERLFERKNKPKYKIGDYVRLIDSENVKNHCLAKIININEELEVPDYFIEELNTNTDSIITFWIDEEDIIGKMNSKDKQLFIKKR